MLVVLEFLVFRNHLCMWQYGFIHDIGPSNVLMAKLWGMLMELQKAWDLGYTRLILESHSKGAH